MSQYITDLGDRLNALRHVFVNTNLSNYEDLDIGVKLIIAAALVELVKNQK